MWKTYPIEYVNKMNSYLKKNGIILNKFSVFEIENAHEKCRNNNNPSINTRWVNCFWDYV